MKKLKYIIIVLFLVLGIGNISARNFDTTLKIYDYAQVLTDNEMDSLRKSANTFINKYNIDLVIITVRYYNQNTLKEYENEFYSRNNFGIGPEKSGIIGVIDLKNNDFDIQVFSAPLFKTEEIKDIILKVNSKDKHYDKIKTFIKYLDLYARIDKKSVNRKNVFKHINWFSVFIPAIIIPNAIVLIVVLKTKKKKTLINVNSYLKKGSLKTKKKEEKFLDTTTKQIN